MSKILLINPPFYSFIGLEQNYVYNFGKGII